MTEEQQQATEPADSPVAMWIAILAGLSLVIGGLSAVFWATVVDLPTYRILPDGSATISERGITEIVASDVWFVITGALVGAGLGLVTWKWFRTLGWPTALLAVGSGLLAGIVCWQVGELLGPGSFAERLTGALPGSPRPDPARTAVTLRAGGVGLRCGHPGAAGLLARSRRRGPRRRAGAGVRLSRRQRRSGTIDDRGVLTTPDEPS